MKGMFGPLALFLIIAAGASPAAAQDYCSWDQNLRLINGKIHTMDKQDRVVSEVTIQGGRFAYVGPVGDHKLSPCTKVIDLHGHTVVPGLVDNHDHFVAFSNRPGYDVMLESARTIPEALTLLKGRAKTVPPGAWIVSIGDWLPRQFAEKRAPTEAELDAAVPDHPVLLYPSSVNTLARKFFESKGIQLNGLGSVSPRSASATAAAMITALRSIWTPQDAIQGAAYAQSYVLSHGLTTVEDGGVFPLTDSPRLIDEVQTNGLDSLNPWTADDPIVALWREHKLNVRIRFQQRALDESMQLPILHERLDTLYPGLGDDMLRDSTIGEFAVSWFGFNWSAGQGPANFEPALLLIAKRGWPFMQHALSLAEVQFVARNYQKVNAVIPIANLHWSIAHVPSIDPQTLQNMKAIGVGLALHCWKFLDGRQGMPDNMPAGPPFRTALESGIQVGAGSDGGDVSEIDPWYNIYYMVTGRDITGELINEGEEVTREQALRMYTVDDGWFFREENEVGSIEPGKLGDLAVLNMDFFDPKVVPDREIQKIKSVLTVVGGRVVYNDTK